MQTLFEIKTETKKDNYAKLVVTPLVAGYGQTLGTALRRVLLNSLPGAAITSVKIEGAAHQFSTIKGVREDVLDLLLNLKKVRIAYRGESPVKATLTAKDAGEVKAGDIKVSSDVTIVNSDLVLANLSKGGKLSLEMTIESGIGYSEAADRAEAVVDGIAIDATFTPIERVNFKVEETRVGRVTNYDKLTFEIWTDGTIDAEAALIESARILAEYLSQIVTPQKVAKPVEVKSTDTLGPVGKLSVEEIGLPTRVANALSKAGFETVEKLMNAKKEDLVQVRNLGEKSLSTISDALAEKGVKFPNE